MNKRINLLLGIATFWVFFGFLFFITFAFNKPDVFIKNFGRSQVFILFFILPSSVLYVWLSIFYLKDTLNNYYRNPFLKTAFVMLIGYLNVLLFPFCLLNFILRKPSLNIQSPISFEGKSAIEKLFQHKTLVGLLTFLNLIQPFFLQYIGYKYSLSLHMSFLVGLLFNLILVYFYLFHLIENNGVPKKLNWAIGIMFLGYVLMPIYYFKHIVAS